MKLALSNIAWDAEYDRQVYELMKKHGFTGLEIAPPRIFPEAPYDKLKEAAAWSENLKKEYAFAVPSMQSIWFGRQEKLFGSRGERQALIDYTKKAVDFASTLCCKNLVFGCPRNRAIPDGADRQIGVDFFKEIGDYAVCKDTVIGMEANPSIYNTNYINDTLSALALIKKVNSAGFLLNLDVGTMIQNDEPVDELKGSVALINHVHISEPGLRPIVKRKIHEQLRNLLIAENYRNFISIEMGKIDNLHTIENALVYVKEIFGS